jgi:hypothetical protein
MEHIQHADANAPWNAVPIKVSDLHRYLNRQVLPSDFKLPELPSAGPVKETYQQVLQTIQLSERLPRLALLVAILFSKLCPNVFTQTSGVDADSSALASTNESAREFLNNLPWSSRLGSGKKGTRQRSIYIAMVTVYIVAMYDPQSPIRVQHEQSGSFGSSWTEKHSMFLKAHENARRNSLCSQMPRVLPLSQWFVWESFAERVASS